MTNEPAVKGAEGTVASSARSVTQMTEANKKFLYRFCADHRQISWCKSYKQV